MNVGKIEELTAFGGTKNLTRTRSFFAKRAIRGRRNLIAFDLSISGMKLFNPRD
jgi:hypothetical protein